MNSIHDLGGMHNFGPVNPEPNEPIFHAPWEKRAFGLWLLCYETMNFSEDESRNGVEHTDPAEYLGASYYEKVIGMLERMGVEKGTLSEAEIEAALVGNWTAPAEVTLSDDATRPDEVGPAMREGGTKYRPDAAAPALFAIGDAIITKNINPTTHTRLPRYARGKRGEVVTDHGPYVFPDVNALCKGEDPQRLYSVRFESHELWGADAPARDRVYLDLFEPYLERA
jgi:nitrile hydratase subunit beta